MNRAIMQTPDPVSTILQNNINSRLKSVKKVPTLDLSVLKSTSTCSQTPGMRAKPPLVRLEQHSTPSSASKPDTSVCELVQVQTHHRNKSFYRASPHRKNVNKMIEVLAKLIRTKLSDAMNLLAFDDSASSEILMKS